MLTVVHTTDPSTRALAPLYEGRPDVALRLTELATNTSVMRALSQADVVMMLGHGNEYGLFSTPVSGGRYERLLVSARHVEFLRRCECIGIWCHAVDFARRYGLHGLFSGMIISEMDEAALYGVATTRDELDDELGKLARRLAFCLERWPMEEIPRQLKQMDDRLSPLTRFNYERIYYLT